MELLVTCALAIVACCTYRTVKDMLEDFQREGIITPRKDAVPVMVRYRTEYRMYRVPRS